jgi:hypothetical protein
MLSGNELIEDVRDFIHESNPDFWDAPKLLRRLQKAQKRIAMKMMRISDRVFYYSATIPTVSGTQAYSLPDGVLYSAAQACAGHIDMIMHEDSKPLIKGDYRLFHLGSTGKPTRVVIVGNTFALDPTPNAVYPLTIKYWGFPTPVAASSAAIDFVEGYEDMIALQAAIHSMAKEEADLTDLRVLLAEIWQEFKESYGGPRLHSAPDEISYDIYEDDD